MGTDEHAAADRDEPWPGEDAWAAPLAPFAGALTKQARAALYEYSGSGDWALLPAAESALIDDAELCEVVFASEHEAFNAGLYLGVRYRPATAPTGASSDGA